MPFEVVKEGEQALITNQQGNSRVIIGPRRVYLFQERIQFLDRYTATPDQYLVIKDREGRLEHIPGPVVRHHNPIAEEYMVVKESTKLDSNHLVVVYKQKDEIIERRIVKGPCVFIPGPDEWLHEFVWHGSDINDPGAWRPKGCTFTKLRHVPDYLYYNVRDVRTNDDTLITVKLMLFYELFDVDTMLNYTHDPIADFLNAVNSDIVAFASRLSYEDFLRQTDQLNSVDSYPQLVTRATRIGYNITKVVYRGYTAPAALQRSHDEAITSRTNLRLKAEEEEMQQELVELKLKREHARAKLARDLSATRQEHNQALEKLSREHKLEIEAMEHASLLKKKELETQVQLEIAKSCNEGDEKFFADLKDLKVDMTQYLLHQQPRYKINQEVIVGPSASDVDTHN